LSTLLVRYVATASLARSLDEGLALAVVLLALSRHGSTQEAGALVAASTFPQLLTGPLLGPRLDHARRPWLMVRCAAVLTGVAAVTIAVTLGRTPLVVPLAAALAMAAGAPVLTGGLSALAGRGEWSRRVFAWDSLAYNAAGLGGPAIVTVVVALASPAWAMVTIGMACAAAAVTSLGLTTPVAARPTVPLHRTLAAGGRAIVGDPALRAVTTSTTIAFAALGGLSFALVAATTALGRPPGDAGIALTVSAVGGIVGSLAMTRRPAPRHPAATVLGSLAALAVVLLAMALGAWPLLLLGALALGIIDGPLLVGVFAARAASPPHLRATVFTIGASAKLGAASLGALAAGVLLDRRESAAGLVGIGVVHLVGVGVGWLSLGRRRPSPGPAPGTSPSRRRPAAQR
jgi:MFS family permease